MLEVQPEDIGEKLSEAQKFERKLKEQEFMKTMNELFESYGIESLYKEKQT